MESIAICLSVVFSNREAERGSAFGEWEPAVTVDENGKWKPTATVGENDAKGIKKRIDYFLLFLQITRFVPHFIIFDGNLARREGFFKFVSKVYGALARREDLTSLNSIKRTGVLGQHYLPWSSLSSSYPEYFKIVEEGFFYAWKGALQSENETIMQWIVDEFNFLRPSVQSNAFVRPRGCSPRHRAPPGP